MVSQHPESAGAVLETQPRSWSKLKKAVAGVALASTVFVSAYIDGSSQADNKVKVNAAPFEIDKLHDQEMANVKAAYNQAAKVIFINQLYINKQAELKFYSVIAWNNAAAQNNKIVYDSARWNRLHQCEQADNWYASGYNSADPRHQLFQGGLGMSTEAWSMAVRDAANRGVNLPASALDASIDQQMQAAQVFWEDEGWGWSCHV